jgi:hypothetical protein
MRCVEPNAAAHRKQVWAASRCGLYLSKKASRLGSLGPTNGLLLLSRRPAASASSIGAVSGPSTAMS